MIDLQTRKVEDLLNKSDGRIAEIVRDPRRVAFSPEGTRLLISARDEKTACVLDLSTGETVVIDRLGGSSIFWIGNRLLFSGHGNHSRICDVAGGRQEQAKVCGRIIASDPTGTKLLLDYPATVVNLDGQVLREFGGSACDKEVPLLSRSGNWAGVFCDGEDGWAYSVVSTTTDMVYRLRRPWGATFALTDNGDSIFLVGGGNSTFGAVMTGGHGIKATTADIVFWPKEDDPWKSTPGRRRGPTFNDILWNAMPKGKSQMIAKNAMALTLLDKELFFVQAEGHERILKAVPLPETQVSPPPRGSRTSREKR